VAPAGQLSEPKLELQLSNRDKLEITNYKQQITNKFQITISKSQKKSKAKCLVRRRRISHCDLPFDLAQGGGELVEPFVICVLLFEIFYC
jgi:hypothetical protein